MIFALLQLKNGRMNFGSRSLRSPRTGFRKTATRSELDVSGARSPTNMLYSFGYIWGLFGTDAGNAEDTGVLEAGMEDAQLRTNGLVELGMMDEAPLGPDSIC